MVKKIVIIGPESTGKSTLCRDLAAHFHTLWCPEYAREYLLEQGTKYHYGKLLEIARGQLKLEAQFAQQAKAAGKPFFFVDTDMYVMKVWCEYVFNDCHSWILRRIAERRYDGYLLCKNDLPWVRDALREYPDEIHRERLFHHYHDLMIHQPVPWKIVEGTQRERLQSAIQAVETFLN